MFLSETVTDSHCFKCGPKTSSIDLSGKLGTETNTQTHGLECALSQASPGSLHTTVWRCLQVDAMAARSFILTGELGRRVSNQ